jgi:hypothetical protein
MFKSVLTHLLTQANVLTHSDRKNMNLRVSYFLLIMHGMCSIRNAKVGVIMMDLERALEVSEYKMFYSSKS